MSDSNVDDSLDPVTLYVPEVVSEETLAVCRAFVAAHAEGERGDLLLGQAIEALAVTLRAVKKLQSVGYVVTLRDVIAAHLRTHANFPLLGSKRRDDLEAHRPRKEWRDCDCDLCIDGRRALQGGVRR